MNTILYGVLDLIAEIHTYILSLNDAYEANFTDKELHFLVIGLFGLALILVIHPLFTILAKTNHVMIISWIYVFTLIVLLTFAIEIGQKLTGTGVMDFEDIVSGIWGFFVIFFIFALIREVIKAIVKAIVGRRSKKRRRDYE